MRVVLAQPRGFCAGVERAIEIVERALEKYGPPIYVRHEIVHNRHVVERLARQGRAFRRRSGRDSAGQRHHLQRPRRRQRGREARRGARPAGDRRDLPAGLEGAQRGPALRRAGARDRADRPCRPSRDRRHHGPDRRQGASHLQGRGSGARSGWAIRDKLAYITQTTLSVDDTRAVIDALRAALPGIVGPDTKDICYATQNRQRAVRELAQAGRRRAGGGRRQQLQFQPAARDRRRAGRAGLSRSTTPKRSTPRWFEGVESVGITAGASAPEELVQDADRPAARDSARSRCETLPGVTENVRFRMPAELVDSAA